MSGRRGDCSGNPNQAVEVEAKNIYTNTANKTHPSILQVRIESEPKPIIFSHHTSGSGTVCNTGPLSNRSTNSGHNGSSFSSSGGIQKVRTRAKMVEMLEVRESGKDDDDDDCGWIMG